MTVDQFLIELAVNKYNLQYSKSFTYSLFEIKRIPNNERSKFAFEVFGIGFNIYLRLRIYLQIDSHDNLFDYRLEVDSSDYTGKLGDEVFVAFGGVDVYYIENNIYDFNTTDIDYVGAALLIAENSEVFAYENGPYILLENAT